MTQSQDTLFGKYIKSKEERTHTHKVVFSIKYIIIDLKCIKNRKNITNEITLISMGNCQEQQKNITYIWRKVEKEWASQENKPRDRDMLLQWKLYLYFPCWKAF